MPPSNDESDNTLPSRKSQSNTSKVAKTPSEIIDGKYRIDSILGQGGMGTVYLATTVLKQEKVALKILNKNQMYSEKNRRRFENEGRASHTLNHPNLVKVLDFGILPDEAPYFVMEYLEGVSLQDFLKEQKNTSIADILQIFDQVCQGLSYAHEHQVIHRDIKPSNIMISGSTESNSASDFKVKVVDFGIAKIMNEDRGEVQALTQTGEIFGSPLYMSPEQCLGKRVDARTDIYSLGCTLFEALTGTPPHVGTNALKTMLLHTSEPAPSLKETTRGKSFPADLEAMLAKMLAQEPADRYESITPLKEDLEDVIATLTGKKRKVREQSQKSGTAGSWLRDKRVRIGLIASGALLLGATLYGAASLFLKSDTSSTDTQKKISAPKFETSTGDDIKGHLNAADTTAQKLEKCNPITTKNVIVDGKKSLQINFPPEIIGTVSYEKTENAFSDTPVKIKAQNALTVPADVPLQLNAGGELTNGFFTPEVFSKIPDDLFSKLMFKRPTAIPLSDGALLTDKEYARCLSDILGRVQNWRKLKAVSIREIPLTDEAIKSLNAMKHLQTLELWSLGRSVLRLPSLSALRRVKTLNLKNLSTDYVVKPLSHNSALQNLTIDMPGGDPDSLRALSGCKNLQSLNLKTVSLGAPQFNVIAHTKSLREVSFNETSFAPDDFKKFLQDCPQVKIINVAGKSATLAAQFADMDQRLRGVQSATQSISDATSRAKIERLLLLGDPLRLPDKDLEGADRYYLQALNECKKTKGYEHTLVYEQILLRRGIAFYLEKKFVESQNLFEKCIAIAANLNNVDELTIAKSWRLRALGGAGNHEEAAVEFKNLADQIEEREGPNSPNVAIHIFYQGEQLMLASQKDEAIPVLKRSLEIYRRSGKATAQQIRDAELLLSQCQQK